MKILQIVIIMILCFNSNDFVLGDVWADLLIEKLEELQLYQMITFTNIMKTDRKLIKMLFYQKAQQNIPFINIDNKYIRLPSVPLYKSSYEGTLFLLLYPFPDFNNLSLELRSGLDFIIQLSPLSKRSRSLIIIHSEEMYTRGLFKSFFQYGWLRNFLDLTILFTLSGSKTTIHYYNPFDKTYTVDVLNEKSIIFPDKLQNMNGYFVTFPIFFLEPYMNIFRDEKKLIKQINGIYYPMIEILSDHLNFTIKFVSADLNFDIIFSDFSNQLIAGDYDMLPGPIYVQYMYQYGAFEMGLIYQCLKFVAIVPIIPITYTNISQSLVVNVLIGLGLILIILTTIRVLKLNDSSWKSIYMISTVFGISVPKLPIRLSERILFLSIVLVSLQYFNGIFMEIVDIKLIKSNVPFDTIDDMENSNFTLYAFKDLKETLLTYNDQLMNNPKIRIENEYNYSNCLYFLQKYKDRICLVAEDVANLEIKSQKIKMFRLSKFDFSCENIAYFYKSSSPYVKKFNIIMGRILISGIHKLWNFNEHKHNLEEKTMDIEQDTNILEIHLITVLILGFSLSTSVFCIEYFSKYIILKKSRKFLFTVIQRNKVPKKS